MHLYAIIMCTDGMEYIMCSCLPLALICAMCHLLHVNQLWFMDMWILQSCGLVSIAVFVISYHCIILLIILHDLASM